jgi:hypothetical protein
MQHGNMLCARASPTGEPPLPHDIVSAMSDASSILERLTAIISDREWPVSEPVSVQSADHLTLRGPETK